MFVSYVRCLLFFVICVCTLCWFSHWPLGCWISALINKNWFRLNWTVKLFSILRVKFLLIIIIIIIIFLLSFINVTLYMSSCRTIELAFLSLSTLLLLILNYLCYWWKHTTIFSSMILHITVVVYYVGGFCFIPCNHV